ncbi:S8 family serine peptidase [uncultured Algibacter sp.]|uniref:S8 family serine peptidase n=1 Tax=uncultured Algibacter sp. TaxID=298659 RepID=UPI002634DB2C|nr:S8 family serine peptidase [uncultured Algibacter sp.]
MKKIILLPLIFYCFSFTLFAQFEDAWVYLADKQNVTTSLANPITILSQEAIDRKNTHGIPIDERDVPVNESYIAQIKNTTGISVLAKSKWFNALHVRGLQTTIQGLSSLAFVSYIDFADKSLNSKNSETKNKKNKLFKLEGTFTNFNYGNASNQIEMIKGDKLHLADFTGTGMTVAVLDAGFPNVNTMSSFERLRNAGNILGSYDFVNRDVDVYTGTTSNHGTLVLSDMAGYVENQFVGTAPDASYYLFITEDAPNENPVEESYWVEAAERADSLGVDVINTSLGYTTFDNPNYNYSKFDLDGYTAYITKGANIAFEKGLLLITSAGNSGNGGVGAPADSPNVLSIGAVNASGNYASFSSIGSSFQPTQKPDVVAQGQASYVITENDVIATANGTSFSSPILAGGIICLWQALPNKTNGEIMQLVRESASQYNSPDYFLGYGIPNLELALNSTLLVKSESSDDINIYPNPVKDKLYIKLPSDNGTTTLRIYNILGKEINNYTILKNNQNAIYVHDIPKGIYIVKLQHNTISKTLKLIKQ